MSILSSPCVLAAVFLSGLSMSSAVSSQTQIPRPVVALDCRAAEHALPGACRALKDALRDRAPGAVQRVMDDLSDAPTRPGDIALALRVEDGHARLDWRRGMDALQSGPSAPLQGARTGPLIRALVKDLPDTLR